MKESIAEYIKRSGVITLCKAGSKTHTSTTSNLIRFDKSIQAMKKLLLKLEDDTINYQKVQTAINDRITALGGSTE